jgi:hypothetical protein
MPCHVGSKFESGIIESFGKNCRTTRNASHKNKTLFCEATFQLILERSLRICCGMPTGREHPFDETSVRGQHTAMEELEEQSSRTSSQSLRSMMSSQSRAPVGSISPGLYLIQSSGSIEPEGIASAGLQELNESSEEVQPQASNIGATIEVEANTMVTVPAHATTVSSLTSPSAVSKSEWGSGSIVWRHKLDLHTLYGSNSKMAITKNDYFTWDDGGMSHNPKYTSIFLCPITKEPFPSGTLRTDNKVVNVPGTRAQVVWYSKKSFAEHAAAARALDCFRHRQRETFDDRYCAENPHENRTDILLPTRPAHIMESMQANGYVESN